VVKNVDAVGLRFARLAYGWPVHVNLLGSWAHVMRTRRLHERLCARLRKVLSARPHPATPCDNHIQRDNFNSSNAPTIYSDARHETIAVLCHHSAPNDARVSRSMHLPLHSNLRGSVFYGLVE